MIRRPAALLGLALLALLVPEGALACAVCGGAGSEETRAAFLLTTLFLSVLPPAIVGGIVLWIWRRSRAQAAPASPGRAEPRPVAPSASAAS